MPSRALFKVTTVSLTDRNLMYSHSPRTNRLPHIMYSMPRPPVQPATKLLVRSSALVWESEGTGENTGGSENVVTLPNASVVDTTSSSLSTTLVDTERATFIRPTARPPNT